MPFYAFPDAKSLLLPKGCKLVGVELLEDSVELQSFHHPKQAAYVLGPERGELSPEMIARCDHILKIVVYIAGVAAKAGHAARRSLPSKHVTGLNDENPIVRCLRRKGRHDSRHAAPNHNDVG